MRAWTRLLGTPSASPPAGNHQAHHASLDCLTHLTEAPPTDLVGVRQQLQQLPQRLGAVRLTVPPLNVVHHRLIGPEEGTLKLNNILPETKVSIFLTV